MQIAMQQPLELEQCRSILQFADAARDGGTAGDSLRLRAAALG
jgi:hypothetical protein